MTKIPCAAVAPLVVAAIMAWAGTAPTQAQAQTPAGAIADCARDTTAAQRLACFERAAFIEAAMRFGTIHSVYGGCMAHVREGERLACFEAQAPRAAPAIAAAPLPAVTARPPAGPQRAQAPGAAASPAPTAPASPPPTAAPATLPRPTPPSPRQAQASSMGDGSMLSWLGRDADASGIYLRGEVGYAMAQDANIKDTPPSGTVIACLARGTGCGGELDKVGSSASFGAGIGYRWNRQFRVDLTADYRPGFTVDDKDQATPFAANYKGDITSLVGLLNAYWDVPVDLGQYVSWLGRVHPWLGFGIGVARNKLDDLSYTQRLASGATATSKLPGATATGLAWQGGLGLGIDILPQLTLDVGYRYLDGGEIKTKAGTITDSVAGRLPVGEAKGDLKSHEMQVGVRYRL